MIFRTEIAELTDKRHDNVMADIRKMLLELHGEDRLLSFQGAVERANPSGGAPEQYRNRHSEYIRENADALLSAISGDDSNRNHQDQRGFAWARDNRG